MLGVLEKRLETSEIQLPKPRTSRDSPNTSLGTNFSYLEVILLHNLRKDEVRQWGTWMNMKQKIINTHER